MNKLKFIWSQPKFISVVRYFPDQVAWLLTGFMGVMLIGGTLAFSVPLRDSVSGASQSTAAFRKSIVASTVGPIVRSPLSGWSLPEKPAEQATKSQATQSNTKTTPSSSAKSTSPATPQPEEQPAQANSAVSPAAVSIPDPTVALTIDAVLEMRVAVAKGEGALSIATSAPGLLVDTEGRVLQELPGQTSYTAQSGSQGISLGDWQIPPAVWVEPSRGGAVYVGDRWYRGRVLLVQREDGLWAINHVLLKDYLYSVVGGEVSPSWPIEALKAQAVAARSYALAHNIRPASSLYDLDNTPRFQAYGGIGKEANTTYAAVDATAGEFISHEGGVVESLYAASDHIVATVHGGRGMSQLGALDFAKQGYTYQQILSNYYPGTALARLQIDPE